MACSEAVSVYYLSSGRLGVPLLAVLAADPRVRLLGVGTQPDRPCGRHRQLQPTPVATQAAAMGLNAARVPSVNAEGFVAEMRGLSPELLVVAAFGQILKPALLALPRFGCLNVHASLLPRQRGASPVSASILAGDRQTGITFMQMDAGLDSGPIYRCLATDIGPTETAEQLEARLSHVAATALVDCLWEVARGGLTPLPQPRDGVTYARRLRKEDGCIDWTRSATHLERQVRAMIPWPGAYTLVPDPTGPRRLLVLAAAVAEAPSLLAAPPGTIVKAAHDALVVACGEGSLRLLRVKPEGRSDMPAEAFLHGHKLPEGSQLLSPSQGEG